MSKVIHFEIHAQNPERAIKFYSYVFGWTFQKWDLMDYWTLTAGADKEVGINGGLVLRKGEEPKEMAALNAFVCTIHTDSVDQTIRNATAAGGQVALAKMPVPGIGWLAYLRDTEGNIFGIMHNDNDAK